MKKPKDDSTVRKVKVMKRKSEDIQATAPECKKRKKQQNNNTTKGQCGVSEKENVMLKKKDIVSLKPVQKIKKNNFQEGDSLIDKKTEHAQDLTHPSVLKKKKNKSKNISPQTSTKKVKKQSKQTDQKELSTDEGHEQAIEGNSNGFKEQKNKKKLFNSDENTRKSDGLSTEKRFKMKKKKKLQNWGQVNDKVSVTSADDFKQAEKKDHQNTLQTSTLKSVSPAKSLQKHTKSKLHKRKKNGVPVGKGSFVEDLVKEQEELSPTKAGPPELSKRKLKFIKFIKQKEEGAIGTETKSGEIVVLKEEENKVAQTPPLKGKALRKRIRNISETLAKLEKFNNDQDILLLKVTSVGKKKKIQERIQKIKTKIQGLELELAVYQPKVKSRHLQVTPKKLFKQLPKDPPRKKEVKPLELKDFLQSQMKASRFRWLNENLYNSSSAEAQGFFKDDPESFKAYHEGYSEQVSKWPVNPLDIIIKELKSLPKESVVADLGCGEAKLAAALPNIRVHSLDFIAINPQVIACDMAHCPLLRSSVDVAVFCLSLMGTNVSDFLLEANRILKTGGTMEIAEVESRFDSIDEFIEKVQHYGFQLKKKNTMDIFFFLTFTKKQDTIKTRKLPDFELKPCVYKKR